ncbi:MAG: type II secretion system F family protein [Propionicimonas sp.]|uniref:type II secretion system F family protein n=1 Tax=Propionicimonas sp. TaxID=1955623 RepID=UPI003D14C475
MIAVLAAFSGALIVAGVLGVILSLRPAPEPPPKPVRRPRRVASFWRALPARRRAAVLVALAAGLVAGLLTGWLVLAVLLPGAVLGLPVLLATSPETQRIARLDGIAEWTRNLSGVLTAGQGLEQALIASLRSTPQAVRPEVSVLVARLRGRWPTEAALRAFAADIDDATGDLVAAALILGASKRGPGLAAVLTGLAESTAADVRARRQIEADRAKPRATAHWVTVLSAGVLAVLALSGQFLAPYASPIGQAVLLVLLGCYAACLAWMRRMAAAPPPPRFLSGSSEFAKAEARR